MSLSRKEMVCAKCRQVGVRQNTSKHWDSKTGQWIENDNIVYDCADCGECDVEEIDVPLPLLQVDIFTQEVDGNAHAILGLFRRQALLEGWSEFEIQLVMDTAKNGDYDHLLQTLMGQIDPNATGVDDES